MRYRDFIRLCSGRTQDEDERRHGIEKTLRRRRRRIPRERLDPKFNTITFGPGCKLDKPAVRNNLVSNPGDLRQKRLQKQEKGAKAS